MHFKAQQHRDLSSAFIETAGSLAKSRAHARPEPCAVSRSYGEPAQSPR